MPQQAQATAPLLDSTISSEVLMAAKGSIATLVGLASSVSKSGGANRFREQAQYEASWFKIFKIIYHQSECSFE